MSLQVAEVQVSVATTTLQVSRVAVISIGPPNQSKLQVSRVSVTAVGPPNAAKLQVSRVAITSLASIIPPTATAGLSGSVEPFQDIPLIGVDADKDGIVVKRAWRQISGPTVTIADPTAASTTYLSPGTLTGVSVSFGYKVTDDDGLASAEAVVNHSVMPVAERGVVGGVEVPLRLIQVSSAGATYPADALFPSSTLFPS